MIYKTNSDITLVTEGIIAHGVNCQGVMGSGVARALYTKWPIVKEAYLSLKEHKLGLIQQVYVDFGLSVFNCHTQEFYGIDNKVYANFDTVVKCMEVCATIDYIVNIPKIGCGLGGLDWNDLEKELLKIEKEYEMEFIVHIL